MMSLFIFCVVSLRVPKIVGCLTLLFFIMCSGILREWTVSALPLHVRDLWWGHRDRMPYLHITTSPAELSVPGCVHWWVIHGARCLHTLFTHLSTLRVPYQLHILRSRPSSAEWRVPCNLCCRVRAHCMKQLLYQLNNIYIYIHTHTHKYTFMRIILYIYSNENNIYIYTHIYENNFLYIYIIT